MRDWVGDAEQHDDVTFVVVAVNAGHGPTSTDSLLGSERLHRIGP